MSSVKLRLIAALALVLACVPSGAAQQQQPQSVPQYVENTGFKNRIFEVKNRDPDELLSVIRLLTSGFKGAQVSSDRNFKTITVRDFPENLASIEDALKRLDTPAAPRLDIELHIHVLIASQGDGAADQYPAELRDVLKQLDTTLSYKSYRLIASIVDRVKDGTTGLNGRGIADVDAFARAAPPPVEISASYSYTIGNVTLSPATTTGAATVQLNNVRFNFRTNAFTPSSMMETDISTSTTVRDGEKIVVGTTTLKDKGLILVVTAKIIK
jgi:Bacterial type II/III secretion system short domain